MKNCCRTCDEAQKQKSTKQVSSPNIAKITLFETKVPYCLYVTLYCKVTVIAGVDVFNYRKFPNFHKGHSLELGPELSHQFLSFSFSIFGQYREIHLWEKVETTVGGFQHLLRQIPIWIGYFPQREDEEQVRQVIASYPLSIVHSRVWKIVHSRVGKIYFSNFPAELEKSIASTIPSPE